MKKYLFFLSVIFFSYTLQSQSALPIFYNFDSDNTLTQGWTFSSENPESWNAMMASVQNTFASSQPNAWSFSSVFPDEISYHQYLFSPRFVNGTSDSVTIRFQYRTDDLDHPETFRIGYCTASSYTSAADFTWENGTTVATTEWTEYVINVPANAQYFCINYYSENQSALYIDDIFVESGTDPNQFSVTVGSNVGGTVVPGSTSVNAGDSVQFTVTPFEGYHIESITVDGVIVSGVSDEPVVYTIRNINENHVVSVDFKINEYSISIHATTGGTITPNGGAFGFIIVPWDTTVTFQFTPETGYQISDVIVDNTTHWGAISSYTFENIRDFHQISVIFSPITFTITASANTGGTISPSGISTVNYGDNQSYVITALEGYLLDSVLIDGVPYPTIDPETITYLFSDVQANHTIQAYFSIKKFIVKTTHSIGGTWQIAGGTVVGQDSIQVTYGEDLLCTPMPAAGYQVADIVLNSNHLGALPSYTIQNITAHQILHVAFDTLSYHFRTITYGNGDITPSNPSSTHYFDTTTFTLSPGYCKEIDSVLLDGVSLPIQSVYHFTELSGEHLLAAYFGTIQYTVQTSTDGNGEISGVTTVNCGNSQTYTFNSHPCYRLKDVFLDGINSNYLVEIFNQVPRITLTNVSENHTISATFEQISYTLEVVAGQNGTVTHTGMDTLFCGESMSFIIVPDLCHQIDSIVLDGIYINTSVEIRANSDDHYGDSAFLDIQNIDRNHVLRVTFKMMTYTVTAIQNSHGTIAPTGNTTIQCGDAAMYSISPEDCYEIDSVWIDGIYANSELEYIDYEAFIIIEDITAAHTIEATYQKREHQINLQVDANGSLITDDSTALLCGEDFHFTIVPDWCFKIDSVILDGVCINHLLEYRHNTN
ncbi:MAG: hypothetical protein PHQ33_06485, partial [Bacteroidales bacterium]|nr:hypothetical protein [Bacteroidales bacterium]